MTAAGRRHTAPGIYDCNMQRRRPSMRKRIPSQRTWTCSTDCQWSIAFRTVCIELFIYLLISKNVTFFIFCVSFDLHFALVCVVYFLSIDKMWHMLVLERSMEFWIEKNEEFVQWNVQFSAVMPFTFLTHIASRKLRYMLSQLWTTEVYHSQRKEYSKQNIELAWKKTYSSPHDMTNWGNWQCAIQLNRIDDSRRNTKQFRLYIVLIWTSIVFHAFFMRPRFEPILKRVIDIVQTTTRKWFIASVEHIDRFIPYRLPATVKL